MKFHVVSLPHTQTTEAFSACAYTEKVRKFARMMHERWHEVVLYAGEENEAPCSEHVICISEEERKSVVGAKHFTSASFDWSLPHWKRFNARVSAEMRKRLGERDFICLIGGVAHKAIADAFPAHISVEFGVGYGGTFAKFRVFESYAWMHTIYGAQSGGDAHGIDGNFFDAVIPGYLEAEKFPFGAASEREDYFLFIGRLIERKGFSVAVEAAKAKGARLVIAGQGEPPEYGEYVGIVGPRDRGELMRKARAVFAPTIYIEPFGNVVPEAMACGTPVITTDWGAFTETVVDGVSGFRCRTLREFVSAMDKAEHVDHVGIRDYALARFSLEAVAPKYEAYFERLSTLWGRGWYEGVGG